MAEEQIVIRIRAIDEATTKIDQVAKSIGKFKMDIPKLNFGNVDKSLNKVKINVSGLNKEFGDVTGSMLSMNEMSKFTGLSTKELNKQFNDLNVGFVRGIGFIDKFTGQQAKYNNVLSKSIMNSRRFKMEWLSVMFAGMALNRAFGGIVQTQLQLLGVTDMMSAMWTITLLPALELIAPIIYGLIDAFMNLDPSIQTAIGIFILLAASIGAIAAVVGTVVLAIGGIASVLGVSFGAAAGFILPVIAIIAGISLVVAGVVSVVKGKLEGIGLVIMGIGAILILFIGWWALIPIAVGAAVYFIIKHWETVKDWFRPFISWLRNIFSSLWNGLKNGFKLFANFFKNTWESIKNIVRGVINFMISGINMWIGGFEKLINSAIMGLNSLIRLLNKVPGVNIGMVGTVNLPRVPSFKTGGIVPETGLAYLHAGEKVIPRNDVGNNQPIIFSPTINVNAEVTSDYDVRKLASQLNEYWASDFSRMLKSKI